MNASWREKLVAAGFTEQRDFFCPVGYEIGVEPPKPIVKPKPMTGLGDVVARVAQPIAKAIDKVAGTNVQGCGGCQKRQAKLNELLPFRQ